MLYYTVLRSRSVLDHLTEDLYVLGILEAMKLEWSHCLSEESKTHLLLVRNIVKELYNNSSTACCTA